MDEKEFQKEKEQIDVLPVDHGLNIFVHRKFKSAPRSDERNYLLRIVNSVPILVFLFESPDDSFFKEINYPEILERADTDWIDQDRILVTLVEQNGSANNVIEKILLSPSDSDTLRQACRDQLGKTANYVDSCIAHIYDIEHQDEWLR